MNANRKLVYQTSDEMQAGIIKSKLEDEKIDFTTDGGNYQPYKRTVYDPIKFYVEEKDYELAMTAINTDNSGLLKDDLEY